MSLSHYVQDTNWDVPLHVSLLEGLPFTILVGAQGIVGVQKVKHELYGSCRRGETASIAQASRVSLSSI